MQILLHDDVESPDVIQSILHAIKFHDTLQKNDIQKETNWSGYLTALDDSLTWTRQNVSDFEKSLSDKGWQSETVYWNDG